MQFDQRANHRFPGHRRLRHRGGSRPAVPPSGNLRWGWIAPAASATTWDFERYGAIVERHVQLVRAVGALAELPQHLTGLPWSRVFAGDLAGGRLIVTEIESVAAATGTPLPPFAALRLRSMQAREGESEPLIGPTLSQAAAGGQGVAEVTAYWATAVSTTASPGTTRRLLQPATWSRILWLLSSRTLHFPSSWRPPNAEVTARPPPPHSHTWRTRPVRLEPMTLGVEARCRALLLDRDAAEESHREGIERFGRTQLRPELARAHLLHGERLRREGRRIDAREQLRTARELLVRRHGGVRGASSSRTASRSAGTAR